jgi:hypothetical protein
MALADKVFPIGFAALGTGYFAMTMLRKPAGVEKNAAALAAWERHKSDARIALVAGLGAAGLLLLFHGVREEDVMDRDSFA